MDCIHARLLMVLQARDAQEFDAEARTALDAHLEQCADCLAWSLQEGRVDEAVGRAIQNVPVPAALPSKILHTLEHQRRPRRVPWMSAAAAALLLATATGGYFWLTDRPVLTFEAVYNYVAVDGSYSSADIVDRFAELDLTIEVPQQFNFDHYNGSSIAIWRGHKIPRIEFVNRGEGATRAAHVYILAKDRFNLEDFTEAIFAEPAIATSSHQLKVRRFENHPGFVYIFVFTGGTDQFFIRPDVA